MQTDTNLIDILEYINPADTSYQEWINIGMALKHEGYSYIDWEKWSMRDSSRYHQGECSRKWRTFEGSTNPVTAGTIVQMAKDHGWMPHRIATESYEIGWDDVINDESLIVDKNWIEGKEISEPKNWNPVQQLTTYLETLFESTENVGYVTETWEKDGKHLPNKGVWDRTAGQLIQELYKCNGDVGAVIGDYNKEAGAWIRFNPLDGNGVKDVNVTDYRYALVESDSMELEKQNAIMHELELPIACLVYSGSKSIHAIVRIEANDIREYRKRVDYLFTVCKKNGLEVDNNNRNPSRLSRMPGIERNGKKQFIIDTNIGKASWNEWYEWIESINDNLPEPESLSTKWDDMPRLADPLIEGVLRKGHKLLLAGPSKAGKSFSLIELSIAIAEGTEWFGFKCAKGKVLYVNLELDEASCFHRFKDVYNAAKIAPLNIRDIDIWNLRGKSIPMDKLAPKLIRRAMKKNYIAVIIDPIYKVITGDENSADQMANFCNQFDKICTELGCAVIYCHHHSKGSQGNKKSMDRASGSGVFARDPDAMLDLIELDLAENHIKFLKERAVCETCFKYLDDNYPSWENEVSQDDMQSATQMIKHCQRTFGHRYYQELDNMINEARDKVESTTAWRIEGTLREFSRFKPVNSFFSYPVHIVDDSGVLADIDVTNEKSNTWKKNFPKKKSPEEMKKERAASLDTAFDASAENGKSTIKDICEYLGISEKTARRRIKESGNYWIDEGEIGRKN